MKAETLTLTQLFNKPICFVVPLFQRPYVWEKGKHWIPLWEDVRATTQRLLAERSGARASGAQPNAAEERTAAHFLGAVVLEQVPVGAGMVDVRSVIDGQQRLTTLQLFLDAAHDVAIEFSDESAKLFAKLTENDPDLVRSVSDRYKVWPTTLDQEAFRLTMERDAEPGAHVDLTTSRMWQAHEYFCEALRDWLADEDDAVEEQLDALRTTLWRLVRLVVIDLEANDNAQVIFETLNARGTPLLASDLIKNFAFREAAAQGLNVERLYEDEWRSLDDDWWREMVTQGRLFRPRLDVFFFHWLTMRLATEFGVHELFPQFKRYSVEQPMDAVLADVRSHALTYRGFDAHPARTYEQTFFYRLRAMETATVMPVLLFVLGQTDDVVPADQKLLMMRAIESWLVRRLLCRMTTKNYNQVFLALLTALRDQPERAGDVTVGFLRALDGESQVWPEDDKVVQSILTLPMYRIVSRGRLRMVLEALEQELRTSFAEESAPTAGLSIEHILPQSWAVNWPLPVGSPPDAEAQRDNLKHSLGNLTLVNGKLNSGLSNDPWTKKHETLKQHITLHLNKDLVNLYADGWDEVGIQTRGRLLAEKASRIWPSPTAPVWPAAVAGSAAAEAFMATEASGGDLAVASPSELADEIAVGSVSHHQIRAKVRTPFLEATIDELEEWLQELGLDVRHKKGTHHSIYSGKRWIGGYYYAQNWIHFWLRERVPSDAKLSHLTKPATASLKEQSIAANVFDENDLEILKGAVRDRI